MVRACLKVEVSLISISFPESFLEIENLGQDVIVHLCTLKFLKKLKVAVSAAGPSSSLARKMLRPRLRCWLAVLLAG